MDPQSQSFTPFGNSQSVDQVQQLLAEHDQRLTRLERRQDDDAHMKSVWGNSSPFPNILSGTPQQGELKWIDGSMFSNNC